MQPLTSISSRNVREWCTLWTFLFLVGGCCCVSSSVTVIKIRTVKYFFHLSLCLQFPIYILNNSVNTTSYTVHRLDECMNYKKRCQKTRHGFWVCAHCDLDLLDMTLGQGYDTPLGHGQQLCEIISRSYKGVQSYGPDTMWTDGQTDG